MSAEHLQKWSKRSIQFAFVVFRSSYAPALVMNAYKVGWWKRWCTLHNPLCCTNKELKQKLKRQHVFKRWPKITAACEPDNIKWQNQNASELEISIRVAVVRLVSLALILAAMIGIVLLKERGVYFSKQSGLSLRCDTTPTKREAWQDAQTTAPKHLMNCYCLS